MKWGKIGSPHSKKRKRWLNHIQKLIKRKYKGYGFKKSWKTDMRINPARLKFYKRKGYRIVDHRILDVGRKGHHYLKLIVLLKGKKRLSVGKLVKKKKRYSFW